MLQLPSEKKMPIGGNMGTKPALAALPENKLENLRRSAKTAVRRAPLLPESTWKTVASGERPAKKSDSKDSNLYSAESIKASVRIDPNVSRARLRNYKFNRLLPIRPVSYGIFVILALAVSFVVLQFAGIVELRYQTALKAKQLAILQHQQDELTVELEQMTALSNIEKQAKELGMVFPEQPKQLDMSLAKGFSAPGAYALATRK